MEVVSKVQRLKVLLSAADLDLLRVAQGGLAVLSALGLGHEVNAALAVGLLDIRPVGVVAAERCVDFERRRELRENEHLLLLVESLGKGALDPRRVVDHVVVQALTRHVRLPRVLPKVGRVVVELEVAHGVPLILGEAHVLDALGNEVVLHAVDLVTDLREEGRGVDRELVEAAAALEDRLDGAAGEPDGVLKLCDRVGKVVFHLSRNGYHGGARALGAHARVVDAQRRALARHLGRAHGEHAVDRLDGAFDELAGVDLDLEARALTDAVPQGLERRVERDVFLQLDRDLLGLVTDLDPLGLVDNDRLDLLLRRLELGGELHLALLGRRLQLGRYRALAVDHAGRDEMVEDLLGLLVAQALLDALGTLDRDLREAFRGDDAELEVLRLELLLQAVGELVVALVRDDGEHVRLGIVQALAVLVHAQAQTAADLLALGQIVLCLNERADLEHVGVVPALLERGVAENERDVLVRILAVREGDESLLFLHDELEGPGVVGGAGGSLRVLELTLLVLCEVALVHGVGVAHQRGADGLVALEPRAAADPRSLGDAPGRLRVQRPGVLLFEHLGVQASVDLGLVDAVAVDAVDEEEREHLHAARPQFELACQVVLDGAADLRTLDDLLVDVTQGLAELEHLAVLELYELVALCGADVVDDPAALVVAVLAALLKEVVASLYGDGLALLRAVRLAHVDGYLGGERVRLDGLEPYVCAVEVCLGLDRVDADALHQVALEGVHRREAVDHVVGLLVRSRVAQHEQRAQALDGGLGLLGVVHALGLVDYDDGLAGAHELAWAEAADELLAGSVEEVALLCGAVLIEALVERVDVNDHDLDGARRGEVAHRPHVLRVVHEVVERRAIVERLEVPAGCLEALEDALADGDARHDDDELGDAIAAVELVDGADVHVGLAGARLHLDGEVAQAPVGEDVGCREAAILLHSVQVVEELTRRNTELVAVANHELADRRLAFASGIGGEYAADKLLPAEQVTGSLYGLQLVLLVG